MKKKIRYVAVFIFIIFLLFILINFIIHFSRTAVFNSKERTIFNKENSFGCSFDIRFRGGKTDTWERPIVLSDGKLHTQRGIIYDGYFYNESSYQVAEWKLRINITQDCYISNAWCGKMEIHQSGNVQTLDLRSCQPSEIKLDYNYSGQDLLIPLKKGDFIYYIPSLEYNENIVKAYDNGAGYVIIGFILYLDMEDLSDGQEIFPIDNYQVDFKFRKGYLQGKEPTIFAVLSIIWLILLLLNVSGGYAYKKAKSDAENKMNIDRIRDLEKFNKEISETNKKLEESSFIISAISEIYSTLYHLNLETDSFTQIRGTTLVNKVISEYSSLKEALKNIPETIFLSEDLEKNGDFFNSNTWKLRLENQDICSADFRSKYSGWLRINLIVAKRNENEDPVQVLFAVQDVDQIVKEENERKIKLERANKVMKSYNETLNADVEEKTAHIKDIQQKVVIGLANVIGNRDFDTGGHVKRTSDIIKIIVDEIKKQNKDLISEEKAKDIIRAAPMHDLGKIYIESSILCKPGKLDEEEFAKMKKHAENSGDIVQLILKDVEESHFVETAYNVARHHHERWDGNGYPDKLAGDNIPLEARIMAVADVYDALVSIRCYKESLSFEKAYEIMCEGMGSQFDPCMKDIFIACHVKLEEYYSLRL